VSLIASRPAIAARHEALLLLGDRRRVSLRARKQTIVAAFSEERVCDVFCQPATARATQEQKASRGFVCDCFDVFLHFVWKNFQVLNCFMWRKLFTANELFLNILLFLQSAYIICYL
jgi:hypothetical protein